MKKLVLLALLAATSVGATLGFGDHAVSANKGWCAPPSATYGPQTPTTLWPC